MEHFVLTAPWTRHPIYGSVVPWSERVIGLSREAALAERSRYGRGEVVCHCVSAGVPDGFVASVNVDSMAMIDATAFDDAVALCRGEPVLEVALSGRRKAGWLRKRLATKA